MNNNKANPSDDVFPRYDIGNNNESTICNSEDTSLQILIPYGGINTLATTALHSLYNMNSHFIFSPYHESLPAWEFGTDNFDCIRYDGLPEIWNFNWGNISNTFNYSICSSTNKKTCLSSKYCGWCTYESKCMLGNKNGPLLDEKCTAAWRYKEPRKPWAIPVIASVTGISCIFTSIIFGFNMYLLYINRSTYIIDEVEDEVSKPNPIDT